MSSVFKQILALVAFALSMCVYAQANGQTLVLPNGDRISGDVKAVENNKWVFDTPYAGTLRVDINLAQVLSPSGEKLSPEPYVKETPKKKQEPKPENYLARMLQIPEDWTGSVSLGMTDVSGTSETSNIAWSSSVKIPFWENSVTWATYYKYGESNGLKTVDSYGTSARVRHDFSERMFLSSLSAYSVDQIRGIDQQLDQTLGLGYKVIDTEDMTWEVIPGMGVRYMNQPNTDDGTSITANFFEEFVWNIWKDLSFEHSINAFMPTDESSNYSYLMSNGLKTKFGSYYEFRVNHQYDYDNKVAAGSKKYTSTLTTSIGYSF